MSTELDGTDPVDAIALAWNRECPHLPVESIGIITRVWQAAKLLGDERVRLLRENHADAATLDLLSTLRRAGEPYRMSTRELSRAALVTAGAITQRVDRAEKSGLVQREPREGSRTVDVELTPEGHELVDHLVGAVLSNEEDLLEPMAPDKRQQLADLLQELLTHLGHRLGQARPGHVGDTASASRSRDDA